MNPFVIGMSLVLIGEIVLIYVVVKGVHRNSAISEAIYKRKDEEFKFLEMMREWDVSPGLLAELKSILSEYDLQELIETNKQLESLNYTMYDSNKKHIILTISQPTYIHYTMGIYG